MSQFLPIQAASRSQAVRIGGKTIKKGVTSYVDLGYLSTVAAAPTFVAKETGKTAEQAANSNSKGLVKEKFFAYYVTAVDSSGNETPVSPVGAIESGKGAESATTLNFNEVKWVTVAHATKYNVFRGGVAQTGGTEAAVKALTPKLIGSTTSTTFVDTGIELGTAAPVVVNNTFYNTGGTAWSTRHELQNHLAIGAILIVGNITPNPNDWAPFNKEWEATAEAEKVKFAELKELIQRSTGTIRKVEAASVAKSAEKVSAGKERYTIFVYNTLHNLVESVQGEEEAEKAASLTKVQEKLNIYQQPLTVYKTTEASTTPVLVSGQETLVRAAI